MTTAAQVLKRDHRLLRAIASKQMLEMGPNKLGVRATVFELRPLSDAVKTEAALSCQWVECPQSDGSEQAAYGRVGLMRPIGYCLITAGAAEDQNLDPVQDDADAPCHIGLLGLQHLPAFERLRREFQLAAWVNRHGTVVVARKPST